MRSRRGAIIERYTHPKFGGNVEIRLDRADGTFSAEYGDQSFSSPEIVKVRQWLEKAVTKGTDLVWIGVIRITFPRRWNRDDEHTVGINFDRFWIAKKLDGGWVKADWDTEVYSDEKSRNFGEKADRLAGMTRFAIERSFRDGREKREVEFSLPFTDTFDEGEPKNPQYYLAYDEPTWAMLEKLNVTLDELQDRIKKFLGDAETRKLLISNATGFLLPPAPKEKTK